MLEFFARMFGVGRSVVDHNADREFERWQAWNASWREQGKPELFPTSYDVCRSWVAAGKPRHGFEPAIEGSDPRIDAAYVATGDTSYMRGTSESEDVYRLRNR